MATRKTSTKRKGYHHGNLREVMVQATADFVAEHGAEQVTVREIARRAKVSSGAPFRHFPNKAALMTAVAEQAMQRLHDALRRALDDVEGEAPFVRFRALGVGYLDWALDNPGHFRVISTRAEIDFAGSEALQRIDLENQALLAAPLLEAHEQGLITGDPRRIGLMTRALAYGLARMVVDGHFAQWSDPDADVRALLDEVLDDFAALVRGASPPV